MNPTQNTIAYIDAANLHKGVGSSGWKLNYQKFRSWIRQKFGVTQAILFIGLVSKHASLYTSLQSAGYTLVFKDVVYDGDGNAKGNCDADLVLQATRDYFEGRVSSAVLVSSDGDYASLVKFWMEKACLVSLSLPRPSRNARCF